MIVEKCYHGMRNPLQLPKEKITFFFFFSEEKKLYNPFLNTLKMVIKEMENEKKVGSATSF